VNVGHFDSCHGNIRKLTRSQGSVGGKTLSGKTVYLYLHIWDNADV